MLNLLQLCLALADFSLQMASWKGAVQEIVQRFVILDDYYLPYIMFLDHF